MKVGPTQGDLAQGNEGQLKSSSSSVYLHLKRACQAINSKEAALALREYLFLNRKMPSGLALVKPTKTELVGAQTHIRSHQGKDGD